MNWIYKIIFEIIATAIYMFVLFPCWIVLCIFFMLLTVLALPLKIPTINKMVIKFLER
ncbi:hypothetical protein EC54115_11652 [Escherichia coli 541-15]|nr:hypothetical protein EC54115_11652 [Escherichia coli 541-15]STI28795.1 Uncharacterised protein [Escherichia coli]STQ35265.1 Uncharacterised protein [Escherichia coli]VVY29780.1 Uncharacterised protein [Escherichia coli]VVY31581.1 Uncharacterised protein [Escherichia coli]